MGNSNSTIVGPGGSYMGGSFNDFTKTESFGSLTQHVRCRYTEVVTPDRPPPLCLTRGRELVGQPESCYFRSFRRSIEEV